MANVEAIAQSSKRLEAMSFGVADYAASTRARTTVIGGVHPGLRRALRQGRGRQARTISGPIPWHAAQTRMMVACRAYGLRPIDGPFGDFCDPDGYLAAAKRAAVLGYRGQMGDPSVADRAGQSGVHAVRGGGDQGPRIVEAMAQAAKEGKGAVSLDGRLIDIAEHPHGRGAAR